jgi:transcriptional regulator with XRE-family HTH domain
LVTEFARARKRIPGVTQQHLSEAVGVSRVHIARIEIGMRTPSARLVSRIAQVLEVSPESLTGSHS